MMAFDNVGRGKYFCSIGHRRRIGRNHSSRQSDSHIFFRQSVDLEGVAYSIRGTGRKPSRGVGREDCSFRDGSFFSTRILTRVEDMRSISLTRQFEQGDMCFLRSDTLFLTGISRQSADGRWRHSAPMLGCKSSMCTGQRWKSSLKLWKQSGNRRSSFRLSSVERMTDLRCLSKRHSIALSCLKQNGMRDGEVMVWLSGEFGSVGTVFTG